MPFPTAFLRRPHAPRRRSGRAAPVAVFAAALAATLATAPQPAPAQTQQPVPQQPAPQTQPPAAPGQPTAATVFGDWVRRCTTNPPPGASPPKPGSQETCFLVQQVTNNTNQRPVLKITIGFFGAERQAGAVVAMPLGIPLARGLQIGVDGKGVLGVPFEVCTTEGCQAFLPLTDEVIAAFKAGSQAVASAQSVQGERVNLPVSLKGFTAGFNSLQ